MCVSVCVTPGTLFRRPGMTSASSSCCRTRTIATRSNSPVTEYTSLTSGICTMTSATSGMRWTSARTRTIAVITAYLPGSLRWRLRYYVRPRAQLAEGPYPAVRQPPDEPAEHVGGGAGVRQRPVARRGPGPEEPGERARVKHGEAGPGHAAIPAPGAQEAEVERRVVRDEDTALGELQQARQD